MKKNTSKMPALLAATLAAAVRSKRTTDYGTLIQPTLLVDFPCKAGLGVLIFQVKRGKLVCTPEVYPVNGMAPSQDSDLRGEELRDTIRAMCGTHTTRRQGEAMIAFLDSIH